MYSLQLLNVYIYLMQKPTITFRLDGKEMRYMVSLTEWKLKSNNLWKHNSGPTQESLNEHQHKSGSRATLGTASATCCVTDLTYTYNAQ